MVFPNGYFSPCAITDGIFPLHPQGFFCFALAFCGSLPAACWRYTHSSEVSSSGWEIPSESLQRDFCCSSYFSHKMTSGGNQPVRAEVYRMHTLSSLSFARTGLISSATSPMGEAMETPAQGKHVVPKAKQNAWFVSSSFGIFFFSRGFFVLFCLKWDAWLLKSHLQPARIPANISLEPLFKGGGRLWVLRLSLAKRSTQEMCLLQYNKTTSSH